jgi:acylphosphatase
MSEANRSAGPRRPGARLGAVEVLVKGRVQGVGYRNFAQRRAQEHRLTGYAVNLGDGRVKIRAEGELEAIDQFVRELGAGPPLARVEGVDVSAVPLSGRYGDFSIRFSEGR